MRQWDSRRWRGKQDCRSRSQKGQGEGKEGESQGVDQRMKKEEGRMGSQQDVRKGR